MLLDVYRASSMSLVIKKTTRASVVFLLNLVFFWDVSRSGTRVNFRVFLCCRWSSTGLLQPQLAAHAVLVLARARSCHLRSVDGALEGEWY